MQRKPGARVTRVPHGSQPHTTIAGSFAPRFQQAYSQLVCSGLSAVMQKSAMTDASPADIPHAWLYIEALVNSSCVTTDRAGKQGNCEHDSCTYVVLAGENIPVVSVVTKGCKGEATQRRNESACTHTNPMQPASHRGYHTRPELL